MATTQTYNTWDVSVPEVGEVDSIESLEAMLDDILSASFTQNEKTQLKGAGVQGGGAAYDAYQGKYVTGLHYHPTPDSVPYADNAGHADEAGHADKADEATKLATARTINGHPFDGTANITIDAHDIGRVPKVYWGKEEPTSAVASDLQDGDLYIKIL